MYVEYFECPECDEEIIVRDEEINEDDEIECQSCYSLVDVPEII